MASLLDGLIHWSIERRTVVLLLALALLVAGIWSIARAPLDALPDFTPARVVIQIEAPGMTTTDVEELVTGPVERVGTPQATSIRSTSSPGLAVLSLLFEDSVDIFRARQLVTERLELARSRLPRTVRAPQLAPITTPTGTLLKFCLTSAAEDRAQALRDLRTFAEWTLRPRLLGIPGVAQVVSQGGDVERVEVRPDPARMREHNVKLADIVAAVRGSQSAVGAGFVQSGEARIDVQNDSRITPIRAVELLAETDVMQRSGELPVRLGDVASTIWGEEPRVGAALFDGKPAVFVQVTKTPWSDTMRVTRDAEAALKELEPVLPPGARIEAPVFRQASFVETSVRSVGRAMAIGSVLVILILIAFLRSARLAAISLTAIPLSILAAAAVLRALGVTINGMTLGGLAIAVGEVVDDAIVDVENVWRRLRENARLEKPRLALEVVREASREIRGSVVYATFIVVLVLVPVLLLSGVAGRIFSPLAQAYMLAIAASLLVALTVTPAMCAWLLPPIATPEAQPTRLAVGLLKQYRGLLRQAVERPRLLLGGAALLAAGALIALLFLGGRFLPEFHENSLIARMNALPGTSLEESIRLASRVDLQVRPEVASHVGSRAGRAELDEDAAPVHYIEAVVVLASSKASWAKLSEEVSKRIGLVPGITYAVEGFLGERVHEILAGEISPIVVKVLGPELSTLRSIAREVGSVMAGIPGLTAIRSEPQIDVPQIRVKPDRSALARYGIQPLELGEALVLWRQGQAETQLFGRDGRVVDVAVAGSPPWRERTALADVPVDIASGTINLGALAAIDEIPAPAVVNHDNGERRISVGANARGASLSRVVAALERKLATLELPKGYRIEVGGEVVARTEAATRLLLVGGLILLGIFVILASAFASLADAVIVLLNFPLGLIGGIAAAALSPEGLSVAGFVGFVTLFGIIARNGIMLVAHMRHLETERPEADPVERVLIAAEERLLPILMTAATAGLGLMPLALSLGASGTELESPMALIVCGGLITSTALNMLVLPTIYVWRIRRAQRAAIA